ncbi:MAG: hypothetical protein ACFFAO_03040, partial [Candidatus Hermodarchaeota archaeon]
MQTRTLIKKIKNLLKKDPNFFQYILKIIPIDIVCETNPKIITQLVEKNYKNFIKKKDTFRIDLKRRKNELIE